MFHILPLFRPKLLWEDWSYPNSKLFEHLAKPTHHSSYPSSWHTLLSRLSFPSCLCKNQQNLFRSKMQTIFAVGSICALPGWCICRPRSNDFLHLSSRKHHFQHVRGELFGYFCTWSRNKRVQFSQLLLNQPNLLILHKYPDQFPKYYTQEGFDPDVLKLDWPFSAFG